MTKDYKALEEQTVVVVKPDGVKRGIVGEIISRFEKAGIKIIAMKMLSVEPEFARAHYPGTDEWIRGMGEKTLGDYKEYGIDPIEEMGTDDALEIGKQLYDWNVDSFTSGPVVAMALQGNHVIKNVRMIVGSTLPSLADPGTIRGDFSSDSAILANKEKRAIRNVVHASGDPEEAKHELSHWFSPNDFASYKRADQEVMYENPSK